METTQICKHTDYTAADLYNAARREAKIRGYRYVRHFVRFRHFGTTLHVVVRHVGGIGRTTEFEITCAL